MKTTAPPPAGGSTAPRTYGQFCGLARALDHVGDRWTLLVVRELLLGDSSYGGLLAALDGIPTNLLADRLRSLAHDGIVVREPDATDRRRSVYRLTAFGRGLEAAILELIRWGAVWMDPGVGTDRFDPRWAELAVRALLAECRPASPGVVEVRGPGTAFTVASPGGGARVRVTPGPAPRPPDATVDGDGALVLAVAAGRLTLAAARRRGLRVHGDVAQANALLQVT